MREGCVCVCWCEGEWVVGGEDGWGGGEVWWCGWVGGGVGGCVGVWGGGGG